MTLIIGLALIAIGVSYKSDYSNLLIGIGIVLVVLGIYLYTSVFREGYSNCISCIDAHIPEGKNYEWLLEKFGKVVEIKFEEPARIKDDPVFQNGKMVGEWSPYTNKIWEIHCRVIDHKNNLVQSHYDSFIDRNKRFARLCFTFNKNGKIYEMEPTREFYELEDEYFKKKVNCSTSSIVERFCCI
jgi:hypothetical protein